MVITREVQKRIENFQPDYVFTYQDLNLPIERSESVIKMLNRLVAEGVIAKISKGRFYKPKRSIFGVLKPKQEEIVKDLLEKDGEVIGYITGYSVFNRLGLTTQVPNIIQIVKYKLADEDIPIGNIADELHFSSHAQFCRYCKRNFGYTPGEWRKLLKNSDKTPERLSGRM